MPPAQRTAVELKLADGEVIVASKPLPYERAEDDLAEVYQIVMRIGNALFTSIGAEGLAKLVSEKMNTDDLAGLLVPLLPTIQLATDQLGNGVLKRLAPRMMFSTTAIAPVGDNGEKENLDLGKTNDRAKLFDAYPSTYLPIVFHAGRVTYGRFFPGSDLAGFSGKNKGKTAAA